MLKPPPETGGNWSRGGAEKMDINADAEQQCVDRQKERWEIFAA